MSDPLNPRIAIIGGGLSGLATAAKLRLAQPSIEVTLFEASDRLGGVIHTERQEGFLVDHGADMFALNPAAAFDFFQQLGLSDRLIEPCQQGRGARIVRQGQLVPIPDGFVLMRATRLLPMMTTPLLSVAGKLRFLAERWIKPKSVGSAQRADDVDESVADFVRRRMGPEILDRMVAPLAAGIYTADIEKLSMNSTMGPIAQMERQYGSLRRATVMRRRSGEDSMERVSTGARYGQFRAFRNGMIEMIEHLSAVLPEGAIHLNSPVERLDRDQGGWQITTAGVAAKAFDGVVVAVPPHPAARLVRSLASEAAGVLESFESASTAIVVLGVDRADIRGDINTFGFVVPQSEGRRILAGSFASNKFAGRAPQGQVLIRVFIGGAMQPQLLQCNDAELIQIAREELGELIGLQGNPRISRVVRWNHAMPQYHVGHAGKVLQIENAVSRLPRLWLVNNALHGVGIAPVIALADRVANRVVASFTNLGDSAKRDGLQT